MSAMVVFFGGGEVGGTGAPVQASGRGTNVLQSLSTRLM